MYCFVRFLLDDIKTVIPSSNISNFDPENFSKTKAYKAFWDEDEGTSEVETRPSLDFNKRVQVLLIADTKEEVENAIANQRVRIPKIYDDYVDTDDAFDTKDGRRSYGLYTSKKKLPLTFKMESYECEVCKKVMKNSEALRAHSMIHTRQNHWKCEYCGKGFYRNHCLQVHLRLHTGDTPWSCITCGKTFVYRNAYKRHLSSSSTCIDDKQLLKKTSEDKIYKCDVCEKILNNAPALYAHSRIHTKQDHWKCEHCGKGFYRSHCLKIHLRIHNKEKPHVCETCGKEFRLLQSKKSHIRSIHTKQASYSCKTCGKEFVHRNTYNSHVTGTGPSSCIDEKQLLRKMSDEKIHKCEVCDKILDNAKAFYAHSKIHRLKDRFRCEICKKGFYRSHCLKLHSERIHSKEGEVSHETEKNIACELCDKLFSSKKLLAQHLAHHSLNFLCEICGKRYAALQTLQNHIITHGKDKPWLCDTCGKSFYLKRNMQVHHKSHSNKIPLNYVCQFCSKGFPTPCRLKLHLRFHTKEKPFACDICDKRFPYKYAMILHRRVHTNEQPYVCSCGKTFAQPSSLYIHRKHHMGVRYPCKFCGREFIFKASLKLHYRTHTKEKPWKCLVCGKRFSDQSFFIRHKKTHD